MVDAALTGDGYERMAELAASEIGKTVAIVIPDANVMAAWPEAGSDAPLREVEAFIAGRGNGETIPIPSSVDLLVPVTFEREFQGGVALLSDGEAVADESGEFLHLAAMASATALAFEQARELEATQPEGGLTEELICGRIDGSGAARWALARGLDLTAGFFTLAAESQDKRPHQLLALVKEAYPSAISELIDTRVYALVPAGSREARLPEGLSRMRSRGQLASSTTYADPGDLTIAFHEVDLKLDVMARDSSFARELDRDGGIGVYELLFRVLASRPDEVASFYRDTIEPAARYDDQYGADLVWTLEAYLANDCNMNRAAKAIHAHRHTVAYRLDRIKELTGLDPSVSEERERLGLGLKASRVSANPNFAPKRNSAS